VNKILAVLSLTALSGIALADPVQPYDGSTTYVNFNTGIAKSYNMPTGEWNGNINWGYNFNRVFALEGGYNIFASSQYGGATVATNIVDAAAKGTIPLSDVFNLYGRAGIGYGNDSWSGTPTVSSSNCILCNNSVDSNYGLFLVAIGGSFTLTKHWDLRLEDTAYIPWTNTAQGTLMALNFGAQYNF
jgi:hypothetical protein